MVSAFIKPRALSMAARIRTLPISKPRALLESLDQRGGFEHVLRLHHLGEANPLDTRTDDGLEVRLEPRRRKRIHTYVSARPAARLPERSGNHAARVRLFCRQHAILDIEEDGIGIRAILPFG
jgi:hypothetical protein